MLRDRRPHERRRSASRASLPLAIAIAVIAISIPAGSPDALAADPIRSEVLVYGGTPGGIVAAVTASRAGADVILVEQRRHLGGMMSSGLGWTDIGNKATARGYTGEFFDRTQALEGTLDGRYHFQPHTAEQAFLDMLHTTDVEVRYGERLRDTGAVTKAGTRITGIRMASGRRFSAAIFIDASYEGDLMAQAGVSHQVGRESGATYGESLAGVRPSQVLTALDDTMARPFVVDAPGAVGSADDRIQASNYRVCFSTDPTNQTPFAQPVGYDSSEYDVYIKYLTTRAQTTGMPAQLTWILSISPVANQKFDVNDFGPLSTAVPGLNWDYPAGDHAMRLEIELEHRRFTQGLFFHLRNSRRVPFSIRSEMARYGLCKDEFTDNDNWPWLLYLREGRRMIGEYVLRQSDIQTSRSKPDIIGVASYRVDSHFVSRWIDGDRIMVEGTMSLPYMTWAIPYRSITPKRSQVTNLLVPVTASASHVAHASLRMEPHYMLMGEAAGEAAAMAITRRSGSAGGAAAPAGTANPSGTPGPTGTPTPTPTPTPTIEPLVARTIDVQRIDVAELRARLRAHGAYIVNPVTASGGP